MPRFKVKNPPNAPAMSAQKQEIVRCGKDPIYFINTYVWIQHMAKGRVKFTTFGYQDQVIRELQADKNVIVNKSRQLGLSTVTAAYSLWFALFRRDKNILVIATKLDVAQNFMDKVQFAYDLLPPWLVMPKITKRTKTEIKFSNGSAIKAVPTSVSAGRGSSIALCIVDEAAHIEFMDEIWLALWPTLSNSGKAVLISTPNGIGNLFHRIWVDAQNQTNDFVPIELPWTCHPERDLKWFTKDSAVVRAAIGERGVQQEYFCNFLSSGDTFIDGELLQWYEALNQDPIGVDFKYPEIWYWKPPTEGHRYLLSADVSRGNSTDFSTAVVFDIDTDEAVAEYRGKLAPDLFADLLAYLGAKYNGALVCPELNSYGALTAQMLVRQNYPNLYYEKQHKNVYATYAQQNPDELPGWTSTAKGREEALAKLEAALRNKTIRVYSKRFTEELKTFAYKGGKAQAMKGYNDDMIMAYMVGVNLFEASGRVKYTDEEISRGMILGFSVDRSTMTATIADWGFGTRTSHGGMAQNPNNNPFLQPKPIMPSAGGTPTVQNHNNPFYRQFSWVLDD